MKKRASKGSGKSHIKHKKFGDYNISPLEDHQKKGNLLKTPLNNLPGLSFTSWIDDYAPNIIWACILASSLNRKHYLRLFRSVISNMKAEVEKYNEHFICHNTLALLSESEFDAAFRAILADSVASEALRSLLLIDWLPDRSHWSRHLAAPDPATHYEVLARSIAGCFDHQSEMATDVRWLKVAYGAICGRIFFAETTRETAEGIIQFPEHGDMRRVRPSIRSMELSTRNFEKPSETDVRPLQEIDAEDFWREMKSKTQCIFHFDGTMPATGPIELRDEIMRVFEDAQHHFDDTVKTTKADPRHDGAFGLVLYCLTLLLDATISYSHCLVEGRTILRMIVEALITLEYLTKKDNESLWLQYRRYGSGQAKLAFLKNLREDTIPEFFDLDLMSRLANEDMWLEFQDINIGNWAETNLRKMAEESRIKDIYDKYYDITSGYAHSQWACVRNTVFINCMNPLHRFHRAPGPPIAVMPSILMDGCRLANRMLDSLNQLYPTFKPRIKWRNQSDTKGASTPSSVDDDPQGEAPTGGSAKPVNSTEPIA